MPTNPLRLLSSGHFARMPGHEMRRTRPLDYLAIWVQDGRGLAVLDEGRRGERRVDARPGHLILLPPGRPHYYASDPRYHDPARREEARPWDILWVHFDGPAAGRMFPAIGGEDAPAVDLGLDDRLRARWEELLLAHGPRHTHDRLFCDCLLWGLLGTIHHRLNTLRRRTAARTTDADRHRLDRVNRLQRFVQQNMDKPITLGDLARAADVPLSQVGRHFRSLVGQSPMRYVIHQRIARACVLLEESGLSVKQVALSVGCDDPYYFSRLFRKVTGRSPSEYRRGEWVPGAGFRGPGSEGRGTGAGGRG